MAAKDFLSQLFQKILAVLFRNLKKNIAGPSHVQHVVPYEGAWAIRAEGSEKVTQVFNTQEEAIERAKDIAYNYRSAVVIHRQDGSIRDRVNY
ncbi:MAG TPA: DUF2188 domain-containing protein [Saprospiraceae bacterium]|nr:DUF2188 domain-containing protein [Saprospiraceae bacterium]